MNIAGAGRPASRSWSSPFAVARGVTRIVLLVGPWAVKLPRLARAARRGLLWSAATGLLANLSEREWSSWPGVAPVRWSLLGGLVQVYPRCAHPPDGPIDYDAIAPPGLPVDPKLANVGVLDGQLVWLDYADAGECVACLRYAARPAP